MGKNFNELIKLIKVKWKVILNFSLIILLISITYSYFIIKPKYQAKTKVFIGKEKFNKTDDKYTNEEVIMYQNLVETFREVIKSEDVIEKSIYDSRLNLTIEDVRDNLKGNVIKDSQILEIVYENANPQTSYDILYYITKNFISNSKKLYKNSNIVILEQVNVKNKSAYNNILIIGFISFIIGLIIGLTYVLIIKYLNQTFETKEQTEQILGINVVAIIPIENN